jgi:addiction module RelE/StbE family toxin
MTEIAFSSSFHRAFKGKIRGNSKLEQRFWERVEIFKADPRDPRLRTHKLSGSLQGWWSFTIEYDVRVIFWFVDPSRVVFVDIGTHDEVY